MVILILVAVCGEGYLRYRIDHLGSGFTNIQFQPGDPNSRLLKPNSKFYAKNEHLVRVQVETDMYGFRNSPSAYQDPRDKVIVLGDSMVASLATHEEDTLVSQLNRLIPQYRFINAGASGASTVNEYENLMMLLKHGIHPKKVLLCVFTGNDLLDNFMHYEDIFEPQSWLRFCFRSELFRFLYLKYLDPDRVYRSYFNHELEMLKTHPNPHIFKSSMAVTTHEFKRFKQLAAKEKFDLDILIIPSKVQVYQEFRLLDRYHDTPNANMLIYQAIRDGVDFERVEKIIVDLAQKEQIPAIDLTPLFRASSALADKPYYSMDGHWNEKGQTIAANEIVKHYSQVTSKSDK